MNERDAFLKMIVENEDDTLTRLVFADWLDEHGEHEEAGERQRAEACPRRLEAGNRDPESFCLSER